MNVHVIAFLISLALSLLLTPFSIVLARRFGLIAYPEPRGWHQKPTPLLGGTALWGSFLAGWLLTSHELPQRLPLLAGATLSFLLGLIDDFLHLKPPIKFLGQLVVVWLVMPHHPIASLLFALLMMNSMNLLDNIDGLAGGVAGIISLGLACFGFLYGRPEIISPSLALAGAAAGFLIYNFHPAKIFMGDCGSLFLGFVLSFLAWSSLPSPSSNTLPLLLLMAIPLADTLFVIYYRAKKGISIVLGGQDHLSHQLLLIGFSPRKAVLGLYGAALLSNILALLYAIVWMNHSPKL